MDFNVYDLTVELFGGGRLVKLRVKFTIEEIEALEDRIPNMEGGEMFWGGEHRYLIELNDYEAEHLMRGWQEEGRIVSSNF